MKKNLLLLAVCLFAAFAAFAADPVLPGDSCTDVHIVDITTPNTTLWTTFGATQNNNPAADPASVDDDVWFKFTTTTLPVYKIQITGLVDHDGAPFPPTVVIEIWDNCGSAHYVDSTFGSIIFTRGLANHHTYFIRVYTSGTTQRADFKISATGINIPANDNCNSAATLTVSANCTTGEGPFTTEGATASTQPSGDFSGKDDDVWFKFTTGTTNLNTRVTILEAQYSGNSGNCVIELWSNCGDAANTKFLPFTTNALLGTLLPNTTYYIRVYTYSLGSWLTNFKICVSTPPENDTYFTPASLTINQGTTCTTAITGGTTNGASAEPGGATCSGNTANDVWYKFIATSTTAQIAITDKVLLPGHASTNNKIWMQVYEGSNTGANSCSGSGSLNYDGSTPAQTLHIGSTYYIRLYADDPGNAFTFNLCTQSPPPPVYNECARAVTIQPSADETCGNAVQLSNVNATASPLAGGCMASVGSDIWLKFTAPDYDNLVINLSDYQALSGGPNPLFGIAVYSGSCGALTNVKCSLGKNITLQALTHGQVYYIRVMVFDAADEGKITVCLHGQPAVATNIDCANAIALNVGGEANTNFVHSSTGGIAQDETLRDCNNNSFVYNKALWFKFTAAQNHASIDVQNIIPLNGNRSYLGYRVYMGDGTSSCTGISPVTCTSDVQFQNNVLAGLVPGNTYFVQMLLNGYNGDDASFNIRVVSNTAPHNNEAAHADNLIQNPVYKLSLATQGTFRFSTLSTVPDASVDPTYAGDVWYKFKAATTNPTIRVDFNGAPTVIQVYDNGPASPAIFTSPSTAAINYVTGLTVGNTYYIRVYNPQAATATTAGSVFYMSIYGTPSTEAASVLPTTSECVGIDNGFIASTASQKWLHLTTGGKMVASIFDNANMGTITAGYYVNSGSLRETPGHVTYLDRNFSLSPSIHPATPVNIIFYFTKQEFDRLTSDAGSHVNFLNDLTVAAFNGEACSNSISVSGESDYAITDYGNLSDDVYYIEVSMPHFSGFFLKSGFGVTLPVACNNFTYSVKQRQVRLGWQTSSEINSSYFAVQKSSNGLDFSTIGSVAAAGNSNITRFYNYTDLAAKTTGNYYYRLNQFDKDGQNRLLCGVLRVTVGTGDDLFGNAYPNPAVSTVTVNIQKAYTGTISVQVVNVLGQVVSQKTINANSNSGQISIQTYGLPAGAYILRLITKEGTYTKQFSKVK